VGDGDEAALGAGHPEHDVREREVGEKLPVADEQMQPLDVRFARTSLGLYEITEGRHVIRLPCRVRTVAPGGCGRMVR
jgi:hypothetical protein